MNYAEALPPAARVCETKMGREEETGCSCFSNMRRAVLRDYARELNRGGADEKKTVGERRADECWAERVLSRRKGNLTFSLDSRDNVSVMWDH